MVLTIAAFVPTIANDVSAPTIGTLIRDRLLYHREHFHLISLIAPPLPNRQGIGAFGGQAGQALKRIKGKITIPEPLFSEYECDVLVSKQNATDFAKNIGGSYDLVYMDPPYNQHPYGSNYFMLNLILHYQMPKSLSKASGIPTDWKRSPFNKRQQAGSAFLKIIDEIDAKYFLISYNSEGFLPKQQFFFDLERRGKLTFFETRYNTYRGSRNLAGRSTYVKEYLFLLEKS